MQLNITSMKKEIKIKVFIINREIPGCTGLRRPETCEKGEAI